jgi:hypothetical protein
MVLAATYGSSPASSLSLLKQIAHMVQDINTRGLQKQRYCHLLQPHVMSHLLPTMQGSRKPLLLLAGC